MKRSIAIIGEYNPTFPPHISTSAAIKHSRSASGIDVDGIWVSTEEIDEALFERFSGIWAAPGSPYKNMAQALSAIRYARENGVACFGTCGVFQHHRCTLYVMVGFNACHSSWEEMLKI